jgi:hypothetical protein
MATPESNPRVLVLFRLPRSPFGSIKLGDGNPESIPRVLVLFRLPWVHSNTTIRDGSIRLLSQRSLQNVGSIFEIWKQI